MKMTDMRAKARAIFGPAIAEPMPKQPNGAKALQERANARPIPTYKVGGSVKKSPPQPTAAEREADRKRRESLAKAKVTQSEADTLGRAMRSEGPRYKDGGKVAKYKQGSGTKAGSAGRNSEPLQNLDYNFLSGSGGSSRGGSTGMRMTPTAISQPSSPTAAMAGQGPPKGYGFKLTKKFKKGGNVQTSADTAKKLATEMGGMKKGGAMKAVDEAKNPGLKKLPSEVRNKMGYMKKGGDPKKSGLAVMIAIGSPMKGMKKPVKKAQGGAGKVRKGMMTPEGKIVDAMNKVRGK